ncbi:hypothetical protein [Blastococcus sp. PRF04-17]|uniref:hypothetical protein n=1 Tax=Blastococcus sp. PRF04-17 TaxID=2933797 RepID=UPI001FF37DD5|nr:hypothetical protein [Blastococcus sp. PRF04-17]UOY03629.1 hypothetical protein MVA48_09990 [Blastococcus sp. PRF04-17]
MPEDTPRRWRLIDFEPRFEEFMDVEGLRGYGDIELIVWIWIHARARNPYAGVRREPGFENLWWGKIPESADNLGRVVTCSYFINEVDSTIQCATFGWHTGPFI